MFYRENVTVKILIMSHKKYSWVRTQLPVDGRMLKTDSRLQSHYKETVYFLPLSSTSER